MRFQRQLFFFQAVSASGLAGAPPRVRLPQGRERAGRGPVRDEPGLQVGLGRCRPQKDPGSDWPLAAPLCPQRTPRSPEQVRVSWAAARGVR